MEQLLQRKPLEFTSSNQRGKNSQLIHKLKNNSVLRRLFAGPLMLRRYFVEHKKRQITQALNLLNSRINRGEVIMPIRNIERSFYVDIRSHNLRRLLLKKDYEPEIVELIRTYIQPNRDVIDVGANVGFLSIFAATLLESGRRVLAVEPTPRALELLKRNLLLNSLQETVIISESVASSKSMHSVPIQIIEGKEEYSSLEGIQHPQVDTETSNQIEVPAFTIDALVEIHNLEPGMMKIDAEGHEFSVLEGAKQTLKKFAPVLICEVSDTLLRPKGGSKRLITQLESLGYKVYDAKNSTLSPSYPFEGEIIALKY